MKLSDQDLKHLKWPHRLTHWGMLSERVLRAFWPLISVLLLVLAVLMFGVQDVVPIEAFWIGAVASGVAMVVSLIWGIRRFEPPSSDDAMARLDATLPGRPIAAISDTQAIGAGDGASEQIWKTHLARMAERSKGARAVEPDLKLSQQDPYALRYIALLAFLAAVLFGSFLRVASVNDLATGNGSALASGPAWEGWIEPPSYTGRPSLYLNDIDQASLSVPQGSEITLRLYGEVGSLTIDETLSGRIGELPPASDPVQTFSVMQDGRLAIVGSGGQEWEITINPDQPPSIGTTAPIERTMGGEFRLPFAAQDDYGVVAGYAEITLDPDRAVRRFGLVEDPEPRETVVLDLPLTISGDRANFEETLIDDLAKHPWAGLPVDIQLFAQDAAGQTGQSEIDETVLPARRFFDPLASAIVEQRRDLLWNRKNAPRISAVLRAISHEPGDIFGSETAYLKLRFAIRRLETSYRHGEITDDLRDETAEALWEIALQIEEGDLSDALERLRRAQDRLADAIENGATDEEIAELMQELRDAMQDYMRQLAEQGQQQDQQLSENQEGQEITGDQMEEMLQRLQELMEQGRTEEAMALLEQLRQMMENMQIAQGQQGQGQQSPGQEAMEGLAETLRQQQGLSDETFQDLQEQFGQQGQQGQQGQGQQGQQGQQPGGQQQGQQGQGGNQPGQGQGSQPSPQDLAERQRALRDELNRQQQNLPGAGTAEGDAARDALDRAGRAMDDAEDALRDEDFAGALDEQSEAIEALREGMRELGEQMAQQQGQPGEQGEAAGGDGDPQGRRDPLGREAGENGRLASDEELLNGDDVYQRARDLLEEIQRRSSDQTRPDVELDYLRRLLDRF